MTLQTTPVLSIVIATRNRVASLTNMLTSLERSQTAANVPTEVIVVDNGSADGTWAFLDTWTAATPARVRLHVEQPNKSRALNRALEVAQAPLIAFLDDDLEVAHTCVAEIVSFFAEHAEFAAAMGRVFVPPAAQTAALLAKVQHYGTVPFVDRGDAVCEVTDLYGCCMVARRAVFDAIGGYDERLGPGATGACEDFDIGRRARHVGLRLGYMPRVVVYHAVDESRFSAEYVDYFYRRLARSYAQMDEAYLSWRSLFRFIDAACAQAWWRVRGDELRRVRARRRMIGHAEFLRLLWQRRTLRAARPQIS
jgi:GT2 family glycosyltransferase